MRKSIKSAATLHVTIANETTNYLSAIKDHLQTLLSNILAGTLTSSRPNMLLKIAALKTYAVEFTFTKVACP